MPLELVGNALVHLECGKKSLQPAQIRVQLKMMRLNPRETSAGLASRYCFLARPLERIGGPGALDDSLKTKARTLLSHAGLPAGDSFQGPDQIVSTNSPRGEVFATPEGRFPPKSPPKAFNIGTPSSPPGGGSPPRFPGFRESGEDYHCREEWDERSNAGSQASDQAAVLAMIKAQNEILKEESVARIEMQRQKLEHLKKEIELLSQRKETTHINSLFQVKHHYECPILGDGDNDVDHHMTEFLHYCRVACPTQGLKNDPN